MVYLLSPLQSTNSLFGSHLLCIITQLTSLKQNDCMYRGRRMWEGRDPQLDFSLSYSTSTILIVFHQHCLPRKPFQLHKHYFHRQKMAKALSKLNIPVTVILDAAVG